MIEEEYIIKKMMFLAQKAKNRGEIPVAAIIIKENQVLACSYNLREKKKDITAHAEILAIRKAAKKLKRWNLSDCKLYVTLKPCAMCTEIIKQSRIKEIFYLLDKLSYKQEYNKTIFTKMNCLNLENSYQQLLSSFFKNKR